MRRGRWVGVRPGVRPGPRATRGTPAAEDLSLAGEPESLVGKARRSAREAKSLAHEAPRLARKVPSFACKAKSFAHKAPELACKAKSFAHEAPELCAQGKKPCARGSRALHARQKALRTRAPELRGQGKKPCGRGSGPPSRGFRSRRGGSAALMASRRRMRPRSRRCGWSGRTWPAGVADRAG